MPITLTGETEQLVREALGDGVKATPYRVKALLERLREAQAAPPGAVLDIPPSDTWAAGAGPDFDKHVPATATPGVYEGIETAPRQAPTPAAGQDPRIDILLSTVQSLSAKVSEMQRPPEDLTKEALATGKLPTVGIGAPRLGINGPADLPTGVWFDSPPFAPQIKMKLCNCTQCKPHRIYHYFCVICKTGPMAIMSNRRPFSKQWMAPGGFWGISHYCCPNLDCHMAYHRYIGMVANQRETGIVAIDDAPTLTRPTVPEGSD